MNVVLLMVALAGPVEEPKPVMIVPPALAAAAEAPSVRIAPEGDSAEESAAPEAGLREGDVADAAVARAQEFPESAAAQTAEAGDCPLDGAPQVADAEADAPAFGEAVPDGTDEMGPPAVFGCARSVRESEPRKVETLPEPKSDSDCTFAGVYAKRRTLSGPWSASRRLQAARIRGDGDEAKRMETMLDDLVTKALDVEEEGSGR